MEKILVIMGTIFVKMEKVEKMEKLLAILEKIIVMIPLPQGHRPRPGSPPHTKPPLAYPACLRSSLRPPSPLATSASLRHSQSPLAARHISLVDYMYFLAAVKPIIG